MKKLKLSDIQEKLNNANFSNLEKINISILRNIMVEPIEPFLKYFAYESGFNCKIQFGDYDNIFQEAVGGKGEDKVAGYLLKAVTVMGKIADGGAKMDRRLNGGGSTKKGNTKKGKNKKSYVPRPKRQPTINNNYYYQFNAKPKTKRTNTKKKQEKKSEDFNTVYSEFYKIG